MKTEECNDLREFLLELAQQVVREIGKLPVFEAVAIRAHYGVTGYSRAQLLDTALFARVTEAYILSRRKPGLEKLATRLAANEEIPLIFKKYKHVCA